MSLEEKKSKINSPSSSSSSSTCSSSSPFCCFFGFFGSKIGRKRIITSKILSTKTSTSLEGGEEGRVRGYQDSISFDYEYRSNNLYA